MLKRLASVAVIAICHTGNPNRLVSSLPTSMASAVGSMLVTPRGAWVRSASIIGAMACPVIAPVSPRQKSMYVWPSTSRKVEPFAVSMKRGNAPGHRRIQFIGTPPKRCSSASANSSRDFGWFASNRSISVA